MSTATGRATLPVGRPMPDDNAAQDAPPVLNDLIARYGAEAAQLINDMTVKLGQNVDLLLRASFACGVAEGLEVGAQGADTFANYAEQAVPEVPAMAEYMRQLRDQIRVSALGIEIPS